MFRLSFAHEVDGMKKEQPVFSRGLLQNRSFPMIGFMVSIK
jgi:hypothetical protein